MRTLSSIAARVLTLVALTVGCVWVGSGTAQAAPATCTTSFGGWTWKYGTSKSHLASNRACLKTTFKGHTYWLMFRSDGLLAYYMDGSKLWGSGTAGRGHRLVMEGDGDLQIRNRGGAVLWSTRVSGHLQWHGSRYSFGVGFSATEAHPNQFRKWDEVEFPRGCACGETLWTS